ncbi:MAG: GtrA family protein [Muribaculum sp.]|nr:GtrA family protein [Muribaculum sp.]
MSSEQTDIKSDSPALESVCDQKAGVKEEIKEKSRVIADKVLHNDNIVYTFLRSIVSSQIASWVDMGMGFVLFAWAHLTPFFSTAIGAFFGGVINCGINYKFTFHADGLPWKSVAVKYAMVWIGSLLLNSYGTDALYYLFRKWEWLEQIGFKPNGYYAAARLLASLLVSWCWNFLLQRYFVYRDTSRLFNKIMRRNVS